ncbi:hypothetical protein ACEPAF_5257 [Sanghuangporus sanghuang]
MRWRYWQTSTLFRVYLSLLCLVLQIHGYEVNVTIDDQFGDPTTGQVIQYNPSGAWQSGQSCEPCTAKPRPISNAHNGTWTDGTFFPQGTGTNGFSGQIISASVPFIGTAVYVQAILTGSITSPDGNSDFTFYIDNVTSGVFQRAPNGDNTYQFNQTVFSRTGLSNSLHTLTIESGRAGNKSLVLLDSIIYTKENQNSTSSSNSTSSPESSSSSSNVGIIVGPVVGGVIVAGAIIALLFFLRRRRQGQRVRILLDSPPMESVSPARAGSTSNPGPNNDASHIDPFITNPNTPYTHSNSSGFYAASNHGATGAGATITSQSVLGFAGPSARSGLSESDASSQYVATGRNMTDYVRVDESQTDVNTALASPPAYSEVDSSGSSNVSRLPNPYSKEGLRLA